MIFSRLNIKNIILFKLCYLILYSINPSELIYGYELCELKDDCFYNENFNKEISFKKIGHKKNSNNLFNKRNINPLEIFLAFTNESVSYTHLTLPTNREV